MSAEDNRLAYLAKVRARMRGEPEPLAPTFAQAEPALLPLPVEPPASAEPARGIVETAEPLAKVQGGAPLPVTASLTTTAPTVVNEMPARLADEERLMTELHAIVPTLNRASLVSLLVEARTLRQEQRR